jgi:hypothetical protein
VDHGDLRKLLECMPTEGLLRITNAEWDVLAAARDGHEKEKALKAALVRIVASLAPPQLR